VAVLEEKAADMMKKMEVTPVKITRLLWLGGILSRENATRVYSAELSRDRHRLVCYGSSALVFFPVLFQLRILLDILSQLPIFGSHEILARESSPYKPTAGTCGITGSASFRVLPKE